MPVVNRGEIWIVDFGMAAKVRPALLLTGAPADDELDLLTEGEMKTVEEALMKRLAPGLE